MQVFHCQSPGHQYGDSFKFSTYIQLIATSHKTADDIIENITPAIFIIFRSEGIEIIGNRIIEVDAIQSADENTPVVGTLNICYLIAYKRPRFRGISYI